MKILLVDDEKDLVMTLTTILEKWGHSVVSANDGVGAQKILEETTVDVIISDLIMPNMDGGELLTWLNTHSKKPHFIIMSAYYNEGFINYFSNQGITNILGKPIQFDKLQAMLKKFVQKNEPEISTIHEQSIISSKEPNEQKKNEILDRIVKNIEERLPEAQVIAVINPLAGTVYGTIAKGNSITEGTLAQNSGIFFPAVKSLWASVCSENHFPKEILSSNDDRQIYKNIISPDVCIYIETSTQMTHGLLRITVDNVAKEIYIPIS